MNLQKKMIKGALLGLFAGAVFVAPAFAANTYTINDAQEIGAFPSGYDVKQITFTLDANYTLTADIYPWGVPGDADGDGDPNASSTPTINDGVGVGAEEYLEIDLECGATDVSNCTPNVVVVFADNTLQVYNQLNAADLTPYVSFNVLADRYVLTITDLLGFKAALGIPTTAVNFGAFHFVASFTDNQEDDSVPDNFTCAAVHLDPPDLARCDLLLQKTASVSTVGPLAMPVGNEDSHDEVSDSHVDHDGNGDSDDSDSNDADLTCGCKGKVSQLTLKYNGTTPTTVSVDRIDPFGTNLLPATPILPGDVFTVNSSDFGPKGFKETLGIGIVITKNGGDPVQIHTSCSEPIGPGLVAGDFEVVSGTSKKLDKPLCPIVPDACPANQQVTYTYTLTNNGTALSNVVVTDNKMVDPVGGPISLAANATQVFTANACLYETTTNIASATSTLSNGQACASNESSVTVEMLVNPPPPGGCSNGDSDSDSGSDTNHNSDSDDSDADSGTTDCDGDDTVTPPPPPSPVYHGCGPEYWSEHKQHKSAWKVYSPDDRFDALFGVDSAGNKGLLKVLKEKELSGKGAASKDLQRHAAAALLNASNPDVQYFYTPGEVIAIVVDAYATRNFDAAKMTLKTQNELGCPFND